MNWIPLSLLLTLVFVGPGACTMVNRTIDDKFGDEVTHQLPVYTPNDGWAQGPDCTSCDISLAHGVNSSGPFNGTWHDTTVHLGAAAHSIALNFTGSAVYVFNMIVNRHGQTSTETHITFFIDGERAGQYNHTPNNTTDIEYRVPVYANSTLPYGEHSLTIVADGSKLSLVLFDYVMYTTKADATSVAPAASTSSVSSKTIPPSSAHTSISSPTPLPPTTYTPIRSAVPQDSATHTSLASPTSLPHTHSKHLATVAGVAAALSFVCGMAALAVFRARKSLLLCVRRARGQGRGTQESSRVHLHPTRSPPSSSRSSLDVNLSNSRSSLIRLGSLSTISHLPSAPPSAAFREAPVVHRGGPVMQPNARMHPRASPPRHRVDVPRSAVSSSRTGTDHSSGSISELRRELRSLREKLRELQSPRKHRLRLVAVDGHSAEPAAETSGVGVPVSLVSVREDL